VAGRRVVLELNNRELAGVVWFAILVGTVSLIPRWRSAIWPSVLGLFQAFRNWKVWLPLLAYFAYVAAVAHVAWRGGLWSSGLLLDTLIVAMFVGLPLVMSASDVGKGSKLVGDVVRDVVGITALLVFYIGLAPLSLPVELVLQPVILVLSLLVGFGQAERSPGGRMAGVLLGIVGIALIVHTTRVIVGTWRSDIAFDALGELGVSVLLPVASIPFVYIFAFIIHAETILTMLPFFNNRETPLVRVRLACVWGLHFSTRFASAFTGNWRGQLARTTGFRDANTVMRDFREAVRQHERHVQEHDRRIEEMTGIDGLDEDGLQLDRREFHATKESLRNLYYLQMGQYRNKRSEYWPDLPVDLSVRNLPNDHGVHLIVRKDKQAWRAWKRTPCGWHFGVGGTSNIDEMWQYDGPAPPHEFPAKNTDGWVDTRREPSSPEWAKDDEPPRWR